MTVEELEAEVARLTALVESYRRRERNQQAAAEATRRTGQCPSLSRQGRSCDLSSGHAGHHEQRGDGVVRLWGRDQ